MSDFRRNLSWHVLVITNSDGPIVYHDVSMISSQYGYYYYSYSLERGVRLFCVHLYIWPLLLRQVDQQIT